ncbi:type II toxin-antitoxin system VapC family toxin [Nevskia sp.]|uniref:type II toxin-antitoxin system VapC family toxin n=1 Tax=Nevskia sp. TaxID=1929292 RepID=UPI0025EB3447|nr:type II toxin-antitoxin system VapC family toxin [Nevskia sp.]
MKPLLLDTHVLVWGMTDSPSMGGKTRRLIDEALRRRAAWVSAISFWEVALLVFRDQLEIDGTLGQWRAGVLATGIQEWVLTGEAAIRGAEVLPYHGDPSDRLIVGTAIMADATLVTGDGVLLGWNGRLARQDARR